ncbi:hypothetical protein GMRT_14434 [Giardia muris]|uniref:Uncharacterized protein n=1 Tax=Giardia muris TaxID=5742 RepID=A0A4Z1SP65_GIAMU|nr:hypothetical protein GMRT_14434 [Giardia muris]|eukprot:TNJ27596.1 hypothetical protein GMRT_14434 [Giardia muris]
MNGVEGSCPICGVDLPTVGLALGDPLTQHLRGRGCRPEQYRHDTLDLSAHLPANAFVLLDALGRIPGLRHLWLRAPCPPSLRPIPLYSKLTLLLASDSVVREYDPETTLLMRLGLTTRQTTAPTGSLRSSSAGRPIEHTSEWRPVGRSYAITLRSLRHEEIRNALLQVPFERVSESSQVALHFVRTKEMPFDTTQKLDLPKSLALGRIFLTDLALIQHLSEEKHGERPLLKPARRPVFYLETEEDERRDGTFLTRTSVSSALQTLSLELGGSNLGIPAVSLRNRGVLFQVHSPRSGGGGGGGVTEPNSPSRISSPGRQCQSAQLPRKRLASIDTDGDSLDPEGEPLTLPIQRKAVPETTPSSLLTKVTRLFNSPGPSPEIGEILNGVLSSIESDLAAIAVRRLRAVAARDDYRHVLCALLPHLESIDGFRITPEFRRASVEKMLNEFSYPHRLFLSQLLHRKERRESRRQGQGQMSQPALTRPSLLIPCLEGQAPSQLPNFAVYLAASNPLLVPMAMSRVSLSLQLARITEPAAYSIYNAFPRDGRAASFTTSFPAIPIENNFSLLSRFGSPATLRALPESPKLAIGTTQGDVLLVDATMPLSDSIGQYVETKEDGNYEVHIPSVSSRAICHNPLDAIVGIEAYEAYDRGLVATTAYGELLVIDIDSYDRSLSHHLPARHLDSGRSIDSFTLGSNEMFYSVSGPYLSALNYRRGYLVFEKAPSLFPDLPSPVLSDGRTPGRCSRSTSSSSLTPSSGSRGPRDPLWPTLCRCKHSPVTSLLAVGTGRGQTLLYDTRTLGGSMRPVRSLEGAIPLPVEAIDFDRLGTQLLVGLLDGRIAHFDLRLPNSPELTPTYYNASTVRSATNHTCVAFCPDGRRFVASEHDSGLLRIFDATARRQFAEACVAFGPGGTGTTILAVEPLPTLPLTYACVTRSAAVCDVNVLSLASASQV